MTRSLVVEVCLLTFGVVLLSNDKKVGWSNGAVVFDRNALVILVKKDSSNAFPRYQLVKN